VVMIRFVADRKTLRALTLQVGILICCSMCLAASQQDRPSVHTPSEVLVVSNASSPISMGIAKD